MFVYAKPEQKSKDTVQKKEPEKKVVAPNLTGIPDGMKTQYENLSGFSFDDVRVHYNSDKPAQLQALAYTQGNHVHIAPGQAKHLGHELGHVVQQKQGRVEPTAHLRGVSINDDVRLERAADVMSETVGHTVQFTAKSDGQLFWDTHFNRTIVVDNFVDDISDKIASPDNEFAEGFKHKMDETGKAANAHYNEIKTVYDQLASSPRFGVSNFTEPDIVMGNTACEIKTNSTARTNDIDSLVTDGLRQLSLRNQSDFSIPFTAWRLELYTPEETAWPWTATEFKKISKTRQKTPGELENRMNARRVFPMPVVGRKVEVYLHRGDITVSFIVAI